MGKLWKLCCSLICCMGLCACSSKPTPLNLVTRVWVTDASGSTKYYTQPQKMEVILYYLRSLEPLGKAKTDPERIIGAHYKICVESFVMLNGEKISANKISMTFQEIVEQTDKALDTSALTEAQKDALLYMYNTLGVKDMGWNLVNLPDLAAE